MELSLSRPAAKPNFCRVYRQVPNFVKIGPVYQGGGQFCGRLKVEGEPLFLSTFNVSLGEGRMACQSVPKFDRRIASSADVILIAPLSDWHLNSMLCLAVGFRPSKARHTGQTLSLTMSGPRAHSIRVSIYCRPNDSVCCERFIPRHTLQQHPLESGVVGPTIERQHTRKAVAISI
jgi:hypothetical protein